MSTTPADPGARHNSTSARLLRLGFSGGRTAERLLADAALRPLAERLERWGSGLDELAAALAATADPDRALLVLVRLLERSSERALLDALTEPDRLRDRLLAVLGGSEALGEHLVRHPEHWAALRARRARRASADVLRSGLLAAVGADPDAHAPVASVTGEEGRDALRVAYREQLLAVAGADLADAEPAEAVDVTTRALSDLADAALEAALALARAVVDGSERCRIAVVAMGKCGGAGAELRQRRRRHLRRWPPVQTASDGRGRRRRRHPAGQRAGAGLLREHRRGRRCGRSTRTCARRAATARWCAPSTATCSTTGAGRRPGSSRRC